MPGPPPRETERDSDCRLETPRNNIREHVIVFRYIKRTFMDPGMRLELDITLATVVIVYRAVHGPLSTKASCAKQLIHLLSTRCAQDVHARHSLDGTDDKP